jgi:hypothetical protein
MIKMRPIIRIVHGRLKYIPDQIPISGQHDTLIYPTLAIRFLVSIGNTVPPTDTPHDIMEITRALFFLNQWASSPTIGPYSIPAAIWYNIVQKNMSSRGNQYIHPRQSPGIGGIASIVYNGRWRKLQQFG